MKEQKEIAATSNHSITEGEYGSQTIIVKEEYNNENVLTPSEEIEILKLIQNNSKARVTKVYRVNSEEMWLERFDVSLASIMHYVKKEYMVKYIVREVLMQVEELIIANVFIPLTLDHILLKIVDLQDELTEYKFNTLYLLQQKVEFCISGISHAHISDESEPLYLSYIKSLIQELSSYIENDKSDTLKDLMASFTQGSVKTVQEILDHEWLKMSLFIQLSKNAEIGRDLLNKELYDTLIFHSEVLEQASTLSEYYSVDRSIELTSSMLISELSLIDNGHKELDKTKTESLKSINTTRSVGNLRDTSFEFL